MACLRGRILAFRDSRRDSVTGWETSRRRSLRSGRCCSSPRATMDGLQDLLCGILWGKHIRSGRWHAALSRGRGAGQTAPVLAFLLYRLLCGLLRLLVRAGVDDRELEIAVLRHQLRVLTGRGKRARYSTADRAFLAAATRFLPQERWSAFPVVPETLKRWRRQLESKKGWRGRRGPGHPPIDPEVRDLILRMARENPRWGYLRIKGELLKLGISVSATTIANVLRRGGLGPAPRRIGPTWGEFLRAQALAFLPTRCFVSDHQDRARHGSGPAPAAPEAPGRPPLVEGCRLDGAPAADPIGDHPEPRREEPSVLRPHGPFGTQVARRPPPSGGHPRDGPTPLTFVSSACLTTAGPLDRARASRRSPTASSPLHQEVRRSTLGDSGSIPRCGSTLVPPPDRILVPNRPGECDLLPPRATRR